MSLHSTTIDDPIEFADLLDQLNVKSEREAWLVESEIEIPELTAVDGIEFWQRHYQQ